MRTILLLVRMLPVGALLLGLMPGSVSALQPHERGRWMVGLGLGTGQAKLGLVDITSDQREFLETDWKAGTTPALRLGWIFLPNRLMVSFENKQWLSEQAAPESTELIKLRANVQHFSFALTWFPGKPTSPSGGLYLKAGAGFANARFAVLRPATEEEQEASGGNEFYELFENDDAGFAAFGELGYEFRVVSSAAVGLSAAFNYLDLDGEVFSRARSTAFTLSLNWYF